MNAKFLNSSKSGLSSTYSEIYHARPPPLLAQKILNQGNTCYLNSCLQALACCDRFIDYLERIKVTDIERPERSFVSHKLLDDLYALRNPRPDAIFLGIVRVDIVQQYFTESFEQHDVSEFFSFLMDWVDNEHKQLALDNEKKDLDILSYSPRPKLKSTQICEQTSKYYITKEGEGYLCTRKKSLLKTNAIPKSQPEVQVQVPVPSIERKLGTLFQENPFSGILKSSLRCNKNHTSDTYSNFLHLSMPINSSLSQCFTDFIRIETVEYECEEAGCHAQISRKQLSIAHPPKILAVHFQRLVGNSYGTAKANGVVRYELEFDIAPYCTSSQSDYAKPIPILYDLLAIIVHFGGPGGGHYVVYKRLFDQLSSGWLMISDDQICAVPESEALNNKSAFMLIYSKRE
jgi:ubiquitin C-terminal hydrolase